MKKLPLVSILIPIYNVEAYINRCAKSAFDQTYKKIEILFFDDKSTDNSIQILENLVITYKQIKEKIPFYRIIRSNINSGSSAARNKLVSEATGDYLFFLDSDDYIPDNAVEVLVTEVIKSQSDIVRGQFCINYSDGSFINHFIHYPHEKKIYINKLLNWRSIPLSVWGGLYKRTLFTDNNLRFNNGHNFGEDFAISAQIAYFAKKISSIPDLVYYYQSNPASITHNFNKKKALDFIFNSNFIYNFYSSKPDFRMYESNLEIGRAKIKSYILSNLKHEERHEFFKIFPDLNNCNFISLWGKIKIFSVKYSPLTYKILNKINRSY